jgi:hypothetical protein
VWLQQRVAPQLYEDGELDDEGRCHDQCDLVSFQ